MSSFGGRDPDTPPPADNLEAYSWGGLTAGSGTRALWLLLLPFRLLGIGVEAVFELLRAIVMLPARVLGGSPR